MKKHLIPVIVLILINFPLTAQKSKDVLYLKNGSIIYGKLIEIKDDNYRIQTSDGSIFVFKTGEVDKFAKESPVYDGRKSSGFGFAIEGGLLVGAQSTDYNAPFSFNLLAGFVKNTKHLVSFGSGVEFLGKPYTPLFIEYKYLISEKKTAPFVFIRGGGIVHIGGDDSDSYGNPYDYNIPFNYKGGGSFTAGTGISWSKEGYEAFLSFAYRYANTSYDQKEYNVGTTTYENTFNRLEIKFGFRF
jgi:hypothetical protein